MYRLMLYFLVVLCGAVLVLSGAGVLPYNVWNLLFQALFLVVFCWAVNQFFCWLVKTKANFESSLITGLILFSIMGPVSGLSGWPVLAVAGLAAIGSKYLIVKNHSHIFNPAAFGALAANFVIDQPASWWVGSEIVFPVVLIGGLLVARKIRRLHLVIAFLAVYLGLLALVSPAAILKLVTASSLLFFAFVMLVEPLTSPQTTRGRICFGVLIGVVLFLLQYFVPQIPYSLELSLLLGNIYARAANPDFRQSFTLAKKEELAPGLVGFWFDPVRPFKFIPGQYLEYTLAHWGADSRGVRRYFTIASSPTEKQILLTTRFSEKGSTFKQALKNMRVGETLIASKVAGDFTLPRDQSKKLVLIAGGIGITPFRSMVKYLLDSGQSRDIILLYAARNQADLVFKEIFEEAKQKFGLRPVYLTADANQKIDEALIKQQVPDLKNCVFYISGPEPMVQSFEKMLSGTGVPSQNVKHDYFPGYEA